MVQMDDRKRLLKERTDKLVKDIGVERACALCGKSKATLGRYYSANEEHEDRFMPVDVVAALEAAASYPFITSALAEMRGVNISQEARNPSAEAMDTDALTLQGHFAVLMAEFNKAIEQRAISDSKADRLLHATTALQKVIVEMKAQRRDRTV